MRNFYKSFRKFNKFLTSIQNVNIYICYKIFNDIFCKYLKMYYVETSSSNYNRLTLHPSI